MISCYVDIPLKACGNDSFFKRIPPMTLPLITLAAAIVPSLWLLWYFYSHNKCILFKCLLEKLNINLKKHIELYNKYWNVFYDNIKPFNGLINFLKWNKENNIKIGILTDYETEFQIKKLVKLNIIDFIDVIVTSEEVGI